MYPLSTVHWITFIVTHLYICFIIVVIAQLDTIVFMNKFVKTQF